ncbi:MAG: urtE2 [Betaproteobacteria bacterium]|jgi:urea transport system ATP-binding protein|nr:urtE2 [Betaproteobacteria bacterium]
MMQVNGLRSGYGQSVVIHDLGLQAGKAEILAVLGRNGMGKTTLFKTLMGILPTRAGSVRVGGEDIAGLESYQRVAKGVAYVPQGRLIFSTLTVEENIRTGLRKSAKGRIPDEIFSLFPVLFDMRRRKGGNLSGGQQQQLAIARALVSEPKVLLLDEPTEGIQPSIIKDIARSLKEIRKLKNLTILVSEQVLSFALDVADRLVVLDRGRLVHECTASEANAKTLSAYLTV